MWGHSKVLRLRENDLFMKPAKCEFNKAKVEYLGMVIEGGNMSMDSGKLPTGRPPLLSNKFEDSSALATSTDDSSGTSQNWLNH
jgi:hypothetical protein